MPSDRQQIYLLAVNAHLHAVIIPQARVTGVSVTATQAPTHETAGRELSRTEPTHLSPVQGGPGWELDPRTLKPRITDLTVFRAHLAHDPAGPAIEALWGGDPGRAEVLIRDLLASDPGNVRYEVLLADSRRDQGYFDEAVTRYQGILAKTRGGAREATIRQHLAKALVAAGHLHDASRQFSKAYELRVLEGADPTLIDSALLGLARTHELLGAVAQEAA